MPSSPFDHPFFPNLGQAAAILRSVSLPKDSLAALKLLNQRTTPAVARAALSLRDLRERAGAKFRDPSQVMLTAKGLEQATDGRVACWRAARMAELAPKERFWDCTAGLGADSFALLERGLEVLASDLDPLTAAVLGANLGPHVVVADALVAPLRRGASPRVVLFDPDRRTGDDAGARGRQGGGRQRLDPTAFGPGIRDWEAVLGQSPGAVVKLPPGLATADLEGDRHFGPWLSRTPHRWTWVEVGGALRELTLWTGILAPEALPRRAAVRIMGPGFPALGSESPWSSLPVTDPISGTGEPPDPEQITFITEARPSARRAGAGATACLQVHPSMGPIDDFESYYATHEGGLTLSSSDFADCFRVLAHSPLDRKHLRKMLREHQIGALTIKKRGIEESSAALAAQIGHRPGKSKDKLQPGILLVAATSKGRRAYLVERLAHACEAEDGGR